MRVVVSHAACRWSVLLLVAACDCSGGEPVPDAFVVDAGRDSGTDAFVPEDVSVPRDTGTDAFMPPDVFVPPDTGRDTGTDAGTDAFVDPCADCVPESECETAMCVDGACVREPAADGTACGEFVMGESMGICSAGSCLMRGCGNGIVDGDEACDDGPLSEAYMMLEYACDAMCTSQINDVLRDPTGSEFDVQPARGGFAADADGYLALGYTVNFSEDADGEYIQRANPGGAFMGPPIRLPARTAGLDRPDLIVGLAGTEAAPGGWLLLYATGTDLVFRILQRDGTLGAEVDVATDGATSDETAAAFADGSFVLVWEDRTTVRAQRFGATGVPLAGPLRVPSSPSELGEEGPLSVATDGDDWVVSYKYQFTREVSTIEESELRVRYFRGNMGLGSSHTIVADGTRVFSTHPVGLTPPGRGREPVQAFVIRYWHGFSGPDFGLYQRTITDAGVSDEVLLDDTRGYQGIELVAREPSDGRTITTDAPSLFQFHIARMDRRGRGDVTSTEMLPGPELALFDSRRDAIRTTAEAAASPRGTWLYWEDHSHGTKAGELLLIPNVRAE